MWRDISKEWQEALKEAWKAYCRGTIPIGCVIVDEEGEVISRGRNRIFDKTSTNPLAGTPMGHAEMTAMLGLDLDKYPHIKNYRLYTTLEPCPMCFGSIVMMGMRDVIYGARDGYAGATDLKDKMQYIINKGIEFKEGPKELSDFNLILTTAYEYTRLHPKLEAIMETWREVDESAVAYGRQLNKGDYFQKARELNKEINTIYDEVLKNYYSL